METEKETRVLKNSIYHNFDPKIELKSIHREVSKVVINFTYACGICELPTALKKIMYNGKIRKNSNMHTRVITLNVAHHSI
jgi:hypothetical protein